MRSILRLRLSLSEGAEKPETMAAATNGSEYFEIQMGSRRDTFSRSVRSEEVQADEDELMWEAILRLPSQKRTNFALMKRTTSEAADSELRTDTIDVRKLDRFNRQLVVKKAFATTEQDNFKLLSAIKERLDRCLPTFNKIFLFCPLGSFF